MEENTKQEKTYEDYGNEIEAMLGGLNESDGTTTDHTSKTPPMDRKATQAKALKQRLAIKEDTIQGLQKQIQLKDKGIEALEQSFQSVSDEKEKAKEEKERKEKENKILKAGVIGLAFALAFVLMKKK